MIITAFDGHKLVEELKNSNIEASVIGEIIEGGKYIVENGVEKELLPPESDELYRVSF